MSIFGLLRAIFNILVIGGIVAVYFTYAAWNNWFPAPLIRMGEQSFRAVFTEGARPWFLTIETAGPPIEFRTETGNLQEGLVAISGFSGDRTNFLQVIERDGTVVQEWRPDWFELWPDDEWVPQYRRPKTQPGAAIHGFEVLDNGDLAFNLEKLTTVRLNACGDVVWKLANHGHHTMDRDSAGNLWVPAMKAHPNAVEGFPNIGPGFEEDFIQIISPAGEVLATISIFEILRDNGLLGLLHMSTTQNESTHVTGDILHVNDIEIYKGPRTGEIVAPGDIMISLRNINAVMLLAPETFQVKHLLVGDFLRQHDPDFIGGDRLLVFDNNNLSPARSDDDPGSRVIFVDLASGEKSIFYEGNGDGKFFTNILGAQQLLDNGNLLVTASMEARVFETSPDGEVLWHYRNLTDEGFGGVVTEARILPPQMDRAFFENARRECGT